MPEERHARDLRITAVKRMFLPSNSYSIPLKVELRKTVLGFLFNVCLGLYSQIYLQLIASFE